MKNEKQHFRKKRPLVPVALLGGIIALAVAAVFLLTQASAKASRIDPFDYISVSFSGYEGNGAAKLEYRKVDMIEAILVETSEPGDSWFQEYDVYDRGVQVSCSPEEGLSNGDTVKVTVTVSENAGKKVKDGEKKFTVEGLPEVKTVDVFADVELVYEGIGEFSQARLQRKSESEFLSRCSFRVEPEYGIRNGDTVTVTLQNPEDLAEQFLCIPKETAKTYTVFGLDEYLTDPDLLPEDAVKDVITRFLEDSVKQDDSRFSYTWPRYYKTYFFTAQEGSFFTDENILEVYVCYDEFLDGEYRKTVYTPVVFRDLILRPDGTVSILYEEGIRAVFYTDPDIIPERAGYDAEEIYIEYERR